MEKEAHCMNERVGVETRSQKKSLKPKEIMVKGAAFAKIGSLQCREQGNPSESVFVLPKSTRTIVVSIQKPEFQPPCTTTNTIWSNSVSDLSPTELTW
jgi:hypothetical protein